MKLSEHPHKMSLVESVFTGGREIVIATMHRKEKLIAPMLEKAFQFKCICADIDTDQLGTFTGEFERTLSPIDAARRKCELAMYETGADLAISSEGSFGAHPLIPFCTANEEIVLLCDRRNGIEIWGKALSTETNFSGEYISTYSEALGFARKVGFPAHALILREKDSGGEIFAKGVSDVKRLRSLFTELILIHSRIWVETDMRAMYNPTRMKVIETAMKNLIEKMNSSCPSCNYPGYWIDAANPGLPCSWCGVPTKSTLNYEYACKHCDHQSIVRYPHGKLTEDPAFCDQCNP